MEHYNSNNLATTTTLRLRLLARLVPLLLVRLLLPAPTTIAGVGVVVGAGAVAGVGVVVGVAVGVVAALAVAEAAAVATKCQAMTVMLQAAARSNDNSVSIVTAAVGGKQQQR